MIELAGALAALAAPVGALGGLATWLDWYGGRPGGDEPADAIVVAGCRVMPDGAPSPALARRVELALRLYAAGRAPTLVFTGGVGLGAPLSEARCSAALAARAGVPEGAILLEEASRDTLENAAFAARAWESGRGTPARDARVVVVTDRAHVFRCARMFGAWFGGVAGAGATPPTGARLRLAVREGASVVHHGVRGHLWGAPLSGDR